MMIDLFYTLIFLGIGLLFVNMIISNENIKHKKNLNLLLLFHFLVGFAFFLFTTDGGGDAWGYWTAAKKLTTSQFWSFLYEAQGTYFMYSFNYIPAGLLGMSFFANTMFFALIGYMGTVYFYLFALKIIPYNSRFKNYNLFPLLFFMPNLHFWSSGIGKDTLLFLCIGMFSYATLNLIKRVPLLVLSLLLSYLVRPHITLFLLIGFAFGYLFTSKIPMFKRMFLILLLIGGGLIILPSVMKFAKIEETSVTSFNQFSEDKAEALSRSSTGSAVDISSYPFPLKVFTFLYRPFFFDIRGIPAIVASFENLILLILTIQVLRNNFISTFKAAPFAVKGLFFFLIIGTLAFSQSLGNVGIMIRMRNMFLPGMLIYILWSFSYQQQLRLNLIKLKRKSYNKQLSINET
jgi:hypothetical protein